jgi:hypothetical protein
MGDNGLSGKKLVAQAYGTAVPIGGGATFGKDPRKVDPRGQALWGARLEAVSRGNAREATCGSPSAGDLTPAGSSRQAAGRRPRNSKLNFWQSASDAYRENMKRGRKRRN